MLIKLFIVFTFASFSLNLNKSEPIIEFSTEMAKYYLNLAGYAYCGNERILEGKCCSSFIQEEGWKLVHTEEINLDSFNFAILVNDSLNMIVITFPGTRTPYQLIEEVINRRGKTIINDTIKVIKYFGDIYENLSVNNFGQKVKKIVDTYPDYQVMYLGHSLGGAMASIMALDNLMNNHIRRTEHSPIVLTYGQPRTGNDIFANELMKRVVKVYRVVHRGDLIPSLPACSTKFLKNECKTVLPNGRFDNDYIIPNEETERTIKSHFMTWHIGGFIHYNEAMDNYIQCGNEYGENNKKEGCQLHITVDFTRHHYFGKRTRNMCLE